MDVKKVMQKGKELLGKYKYALIVLLVGLILLNLPVKKAETKPQVQESAVVQTFDTDELTQILQHVDGAGKVEVLLSVATGEETIYQTDSDTTTENEGSTSRIETVIVSGADRDEAGLVKQINPPTYLGAVVVCEGADSATVRLAIMQAVAKATGLGADQICVLKMK